MGRPPAPPGAQGWGAPPYGPPGAAPPGYGAGPYAGTGQAPAPEPQKRRRTGLVIAALVVALLVLGGVAAVGLMAFGSSSELALTIDTCQIASDGSMTASGTVDGPSGTGVNVRVVFTDVETGEQVDTGDTSVDLGTSISGGDPWSVSGIAGNQVQQVSCDVTADD